MPIIRKQTRTGHANTSTIASQMLTMAANTSTVAPQMLIMTAKIRQITKSAMQITKSARQIATRQRRTARWKATDRLLRADKTRKTTADQNTHSEQSNVFSASLGRMMMHPIAEMARLPKPETTSTIDL